MEEERYAILSDVSILQIIIELKRFPGHIHSIVLFAEYPFFYSLRKDHRSSDLILACPSFLMKLREVMSQQKWP